MNTFFVIHNCELFYGITDEEIKQLLECLRVTEQNYADGEIICPVGSKVEKAGLILSGRIYMEIYDYLGNKSIISEFTQGQAFGENYALTHNTELPYNIVAKGETCIMWLTLCKLSDPCSKRCLGHRKMLENLLQSVSMSSCDLSTKLMHISQRTTREKLISYFSEQSKKQRSTVITLPFNRQELADYLSVDRSAMSKELSKMKKEGLIDYKHNVFTLKVK